MIDFFDEFEEDCGDFEEDPNAKNDLSEDGDDYPEGFSEETEQVNVESERKIVGWREIAFLGAVSEERRRRRKRRKRIRIAANRDGDGPGRLRTGLENLQPAVFGPVPFDGDSGFAIWGGSPIRFAP